ncbi:hypothetical protein GUITHDRAFT_106549 [Guillardia theta CCMP2712]|uniref:Uncharacterized protein n=2 Tax=Guillardia theta TaxID=55529 RepID=L1JGV2_GUITC|nr:hypothetical protein GUITHDRAFT_106549 [Guillardia theta CCMP2712]EKX47562.1 hypothetical protein GUITHDRAFT_106549 [Guillardia theta CCMP2712]|eukprot:XP_005834542.1 hypothetical protein GUITHDRAFT_106549 [Guillardia theta CCMP2712]
MRSRMVRCSYGSKCAIVAMMAWDLMACSVNVKNSEQMWKRSKESCSLCSLPQDPLEAHFGSILLNPSMHLRGGQGQRKLLRLRQQRRQERMRDELELRGLSEIDGAMLKKKMTKRQQQQLQEPLPTWEEYREKLLEKEWKTAERRMKAIQRNEELQSLRTDQTFAKNEEDLSEEWQNLPPMRKVNDGKGHIDFVGESLCPPNITDINEKLVWIEDHYEPFDRYITMEDIIADQRATATVTAKEKLRACTKELIKDLNISVPGSLKEASIRVNTSKEDLDARVETMTMRLREILKLNSFDVDALCTYGIALHTWMDDADGAEYMFKRALLVNPKHATTLCSYARLLRDARGDHNKALELLRKAVEYEPENPWLKLVLKEDEWKSYANVRVDRKVDFSSKKSTDEGVGVQLAKDI